MARRLAEAALLGGATVALTLLVFSAHTPLVYVVLPLPIWAGLRFSQAGAAVVSLVIAVIAVGSTASGVGPVTTDSADVNLLVAQTFVGVGAVIGLLLAAVTAERRRAQASLVASQATLEAKVGERTATLARTRLRLLEAQELSHIGGWEWDVRADVVTCSDELYRIFGVSPSEHTPTLAGHLERLHPDDRDRVQTQVSSVLAAGDTFSFDERIIRPDGAVRTLASRGQVHRDSAGRPLRLVGVCQDVTESRRAERALRDSEERARLIIIDAASDAFIACDERDVITEWNRQAEELFGWTREEAIGRRLADVVGAGRNRARQRAALARYLKTGDAAWLGKRMQRTGRHRDGREFPVELTISPVRTEEGTNFTCSCTTSASACATSSFSRPSTPSPACCSSHRRSRRRARACSRRSERASDGRWARGGRSTTTPASCAACASGAPARPRRPPRSRARRWAPSCRSGAACRGACGRRARRRCWPRFPTTRAFRAARAPGRRG